MARNRDGRLRGGEWIGGRFPLPVGLTGEDTSFQPECVIWVDMTEGMVAAHDLVRPGEGEGAVARVLLDALAPWDAHTPPPPALQAPPTAALRPSAPLPPPSRLRVDDEAAAAAIRAARPDIPVVVAPTPELDEIVEEVCSSLTGDDLGYLDGGRLSAACMADVFEAACALHAIAPWRTMTGDQAVRLDVPALGVEGACVVVIGALGESLGLLIFPSLDAYDAFAEAADERPPPGEPLDFGTGWLALHFVDAGEVLSGMRADVAEHGWPIAGEHAYPLVDRRGRDGAVRAASDHDLRLAAACARAFGAFYLRHEGAFGDEDPEPLCETITDSHGGAVRLRYPYEAFDAFDPDPFADEVPDGARGLPAPPLAAPPTPGRNDPCPCGSGRKYKKCHMQADQTGRGDAARAARTHPLDRRLVDRLAAFAAARFGAAALAYTRDFDDAEAALQLAVPWSVYGAHVEGRSVVDWFLDVQDTRLPQPERAWLEAQRAAWLSVWEVTAVERGRGLTLCDQLSGEERRVLEVLGSETLVVRDAVLGRVVDHDGLALLCGVHPRPLPPLAAADLVRRARGRLRRKREVPVERLRDGELGRYLIRRWEETVREEDRRRATPPELVNTDGDTLLLTTDHFALEPGARADVAARLAALPGAQAEHEDDALVVHFSQPGNRVHAEWSNTLIGLGRLTDRGLRLETNSTKRANALRRRVEEACGGLIRHRAREVVDPRSERLPEPPPLPPPTPEQRRIERQIEARHYAAWSDAPIPALGGITPRQAVRDAQGRAAVDALIKDMENSQARSGLAEGFDFGTLRRDLELE